MSGERMKLTFRGYTFDARTVAMIRWAEKRAGFRFRITQGSYNVGQVAASAGTHDKAAADFGVPARPDDEHAMLKALKDAGFATWRRHKSDGFTSEHIHAVPLDGNLSRVALQQQTAYLDHRDGLRSNGPDRSYRPTPQVTFSLPLMRPIVRKAKP